MDLLFISALILLYIVTILSIFELRYLVNIDREIEVPKYEDLKRPVRLFVIYPVKNEYEDVIIKKIEYLYKINNPYKNFDLRFVFIDDTDINKEKVLVNYLDSKKLGIYTYKNFLIYDLGKIIYIFRFGGIKRKGAALDELIDFLVEKFGIEYVSIYDLEWTVTVDYLYKAVCILESNKDLSFVYWNRRTVPVDYYHKLVGIYVDTFFELTLPAKNLLDDISMVHGSCGVLRVRDYKVAGGFTPHLTEDASLTLRLYMNGYKGIYIRNWIEYGQNLPPNFNMTMKTLRRWQTGTFDVIYSNLFKLLFNENLNLKQKLSFMHMFSSIYIPLLSFVLISISIYSIISNYSSGTYQYIFPFFYFATLYIVLLMLYQYYKVEERIYGEGSLKDAFLVLLIGWGISSLTIVYYLRRILFGMDNKWIVTKKKVIRYNYDYYSITVLLIFLIINLIFIIRAMPWLIYLYYNDHLLFLLTITLGELSSYIWVLSILFIFYLMYRGYTMKEKDVGDLLYLGIRNLEIKDSPVKIKNEYITRSL
ncbi:MAG: glycosyltransferase family 2 protein [Nanopusillaceae archaeon]